MRIGKEPTGDRQARLRITTMFSRLRSQDADRADPNHDLACRYVALPEVAMKLVRPFLPEKERAAEDSSLVRLWRGTIHTQFVALGRPILHRLLRRQDGRSNTPIGYLDVTLPYTYEVRRVGESRSVSYDEGEDSDWQRDPLGEWNPITRSLVVEVKIQPVSVDEIVRQVNLYREFLPAEGWVAVTGFPISAPETAELLEAKITHVRLGPKFEAFAAAQRSLPPDLSSAEI